MRTRLRSGELRRGRLRGKGQGQGIAQSGPADLYERFALRALRFKSGSLSLEDKGKGLSAGDPSSLCRATPR